MAGDAGELKSTLSMENKQFIDAMNEAAQAVTKGTDFISKQFGQMGALAGSLGDMLSALGVSGGLAKLGSMAMDAVNAVDKLHSAFVALNGATAETEALFEELQEMEAKSAFDFEEVLGPAAKSMLQMGVSADLTAKSIQGLVDTAAALKLAPETISNVAATLGKMNQAVIVSDRHMRSLVQDGVQAWDALAKKLNTDVSDAHEKVKAGVISARTVIEAVAEQAAAKWGGAAEKTVHTWAGAMNQLDQATEDVLVAIGRDLKNMGNDAAPALEVVVKSVKEFAKWIAELPAPVKNAAVAFVALASALGTVAAVWPLVAKAATAAGTALAGWPLVIAAVVAGLVLLGTWIKENWEPITAVVSQAWDGVAQMWSAAWGGIQSYFAGVTAWWDKQIRALTFGALGVADIWEGVKTAWSAAWGVITRVVGAAWDNLAKTFGLIAKAVGIVGDAIKNFVASLPGGDKLTTLGDTWDRESKKAAEAKAATDELGKAKKKEAEATAAQNAEDKKRADAMNEYALLAKGLGIQTQKDLDDKVKSAKLAAAAMSDMVAKGIGSEKDLLAARQAVTKAEKEAAEGSKNLVDARKKSADEAKKNADEAKKNAEEIRKAYESLRAVSPALAADFSKAMGGIADNSKNAAAAVETVRKRMGESFAAQVQAAFDLAEAYKGLGVASEAALSAAADKADESFRRVKAAFDAGKASQVDYEASLDGVTAAHQKLADYLNRDLKKAFEEQKLTQEQYYQFILDRAIETQAKLLASGTATNEQILAAEKMVANARAALTKATAKTVEEQYRELGLKTVAELNKTADEWKKYADTVAKVSGSGSKLALEAMVKALEAQRAAMSAAGKDTTALDAQIKGLKRQIEALLPEVERLENAFKALGVSSQKALTDAAKEAANALGEVKRQLDAGKTTQADYYATQKQVEEQFQRIADHITGEYKDAFEKGTITAVELANKQVEAAKEILAEMKRTSDGSVEALNAIAAAEEFLAKKTKDVADSVKKDLEGAYHSVGEKTREELEKAAKVAKENYEKIRDSSTENSEAALKARIAHLEILQELHRNFGTAWSEEEEKQLRDSKKKLEQMTKEKRDVWGDFFDDVKDRAQDFKNNVLDALVFGGPSKEHNKQLDEQAAELHKSLAERAKEWDDFVAEVAGKQATATKKYEDALLAEDEALSNSLRDREEGYREFAAEVGKNIADIVGKHQREAEEEVEAARSAFEEKQEEYDLYAREVAERIEEIHEKYTEELEDEEEELRDSLEDRAQDYADFVDDVNKKLSRVGQDTAQNIEDETKDTAQNIDERKKDYARYAEDVERKIRQLREKNKGSNSDEEEDLRISLRRKQEDLDDYIKEQNEKLERYTRDQKQREEREVEDAKETLERKTRDYDEWQTETLEKHDKRVSDIREKENAEVANAEEGLAKKKTALDNFAIETAKTIEKIRADHAAEQDAEVAKQEEALGKKKKAYEDAVAADILKSDERKTAIQKSYEDETAKLNEELGKQKTEYENFVADITGPDGKLAQLKAAHKSVWDDIFDMGKTALQGIGSEMLHLISDEVLGSVMKGFLGEGGFGGLGKALGGLFSGIFGGGGGGGSTSDLGGYFDSMMGGAGGLISKIPGLGGKGGSSVIGKLFGATSAFNPVMAGLQVGGDILNFIGTMRTEGTMNQVERNTAAASIHLQHILEDGVNGWLPYLSSISGFLWEVYAEAFASLMTTNEETRDLTRTNLPKLEEIRFNTEWAKTFEDMNRMTLYEIRDAINDHVVPNLVGIRENTGSESRSITVNVTATGVTPETARTLGNQIANNLANQLVGPALR